MKRFLCFITILCMVFPSILVSADSGITIEEVRGGFESVAVIWTNPNAETGYNVYVKKSADADYPQQPIDKELIRYYGGYYRADALGLAAGEYDVKIENADKSSSAESKNIAVSAYRREGFAFSSSSPNKSASGGYNDDGTVKSDAQILYITNENVNTVKFGIKEGSKIKEYTGLKNILQSYRKDSRPLIVRFIGMIDGEKISGLVVSDGKPAFLESKESKNITFEGVGDDATLKWFGLNLNGNKNTEIRNLGLVLFTDDGISINGSNENIWVHNIDFYYGKTDPKEDDKIKGDGALDIKAGAKYCTLSYNHFWDSGKCSLIQPNSKSDTGDGTDYLTYHHNWFDHSDSRHPRTRYSNVHMYNNYFDGNSGYGIGVTSGASLFAENNAFRGVSSPMLSSKQGHDDGTFSGEAGGIIKSYNNLMIDCGDVAYYSGTKDFDAYLASSRDEEVPSSVTTKQKTYVKSGVTYTYRDTYSNFDTKVDLVSNPDPAESVAEDVKSHAGRSGGGDIVFDLSNYAPTDTKSPDTSHDIVPELKKMLEDYQSSVVKNYVGDEIEYPATSGEIPAPKPTEKPTPAPTGTPVPTSTPAPTGTPAPTSTLAPTGTPISTASPIPTVTPISTAAPTTTPTSVETPKISISSFIGGKTVTLTTATEGAQIYYTLDGTAPSTSSNPYGGPITLTETASIKAIAVKDGMNPSKTAGGRITVGNTAAPASSHNAGQLEVGTVITLRSETSGSMIYYTTDGSNPTTESQKYSGGIAITTDVTIKAIAVKDGYKNSGIFEAAYTVPKIEPGSAAISVGSASGAAGDTISIPVYLFTEEESGITEYRFTMNYDASKFEYESVTPAEGAEASDLFTSVSGGAVTVLYSGAAIESGEVCDINLKALESDEDGEYPISIQKDSVKIETGTGNKYNIDITDGIITLIGSNNSNLELRSDVMLTDPNGNDITEKHEATGRVTANVTLENANEEAAIEPMTVNIIMAVYDQNGCLVSMSVMDADLSDLNYVFTNTIDIPENVEVDSIKLMVWNGLSDMTPMSAASEIL